MAEGRQLLARDLVAQLRLVAEGEQRFLAARGGAGARDGQHLVPRHVGALSFAGRVREGAVMADVAAELGQRNEDLAGIAERNRMSLVAQSGGRGGQRGGVVDVGERQRGCAVEPAARRHGLLREIAAHEPAPPARRGSSQSRAAMPLELEIGMRARRAAPLDQHAEIVRHIDVERDARQVDDPGLDPALAGGGEVRLEAVVAEAEGDEPRRREGDAVRAAAVMRRHDGHARRCVMGGEHGIDFGRGNQRRVAGHRDHAFGALCLEFRCRALDRGGLALVFRLLDQARAIGAGDGGRFRVARHHDDAFQRLGPRHRRQHVLIHGPEQQTALRGTQRAGEPLLRVHEIFCRQHRPHARIPCLVRSIGEARTIAGRAGGGPVG